MNRAVLAAVAATLLLPRASAQQERVYIACDDHTDYLWTADDNAYRKAFQRMLDHYLTQVDLTANDPPEYQARFNTDGSLWLWEYERNKSPTEFARLISRLRDGHISSPLNALVVCFGGVPAEAVLRGMYYPGHLERRFGLRFELAIAMENQTLPFGLPSLWAGAGARYSWRGICNCASFIPDAWDREHDIYWAEGPDGSRVLMKWQSQLVNNESMGGYAEARDPKKIVDYVTHDPGFRARYPYPIIGAFGKGWDDFQTFTNEFPVAAKMKTDGTRRVIVSNELDFFEDFERHYGGLIPTVATSFGNEWDTLCATMAEVSATVKRSLATLRTGEALATLASLYDHGFMVGREAARDQAFMDLGLYWEHDWTANGPAVPASVRAAWQRRLASEIADYANTLQTDGLAALGDLVTKSGSNPRFVVFNPLSFSRHDAADLPYTPTALVHVVDVTSGQEVPSQLMTDPVSGKKHLRILASHVPGLGYRVYEVQSGAGKNFGAAATIVNNVITNSKCGLTVASDGTIQSYVDHTRGGREFVQKINGFAMNDLGWGNGASLVSENVGAVSATILATAGGNVPHRTRVTLVRDDDRVLVDNEITQNFTRVENWRFSFKLQQPIVRHEEVGAIATARLESAGGDYSNRNARYDYLTFNHFADITSETGDVGMTLGNLDCYFFKLGRSEIERLDQMTPQISALAGGQVDSANLGIAKQDGDSYFRQRFVLRTHGAYDPVRAMETALAAESPLIATAVTGTNARLPPDRFHLLDCTNSDVLVWALKPAEEGILNGVIVRLWNVSDQPQTTVLQLNPRPIGDAIATTHIETDLNQIPVGPGGVTVDLARQQLRTLRLRFGHHPLGNGF